MDKNELIWDKYKFDIELHRGYLDLVIKINVFYYAVTGAIVSFYFSHIGDDPLLRYSLLLPILMSLGLCFFFWNGANAAKISQLSLQNSAGALELTDYSAICSVLENILRIFSVILFLVSIGLLIFFFKDFISCRWK